MQLGKALNMVEDSPDITMRHVTTFQCRLDVLTGGSVLWHISKPGELLFLTLLLLPFSSSY